MKSKFLVITLSLLGIPLASAQDFSTNYVITVGYLPATHDTLLFIALREKFFPKNLDVRLVKYSSSPDALNELRAGRVDIAIPGVAAPIQRIADGEPFTIVGGAAQESAAVVVKPAHREKFFEGNKLRSLDARVQAFSKMKVGSVKLSTGDALFRCVVMDKQVPVSIDDSYHNPKDVLFDLKGGKLDAAVLWSPHMTTAENDGMPIVLWLGEVLPRHVCCRQVVRDDYLSANREALVLYLVGLIKARVLYESAQTSANDRERVLKAVGEYVLNPVAVLEKELFSNNGEPPRTKLSVDLNQQGIADYLVKMAQGKIIDDAQIDRVNKRIDSSLLYDAYRRLNLSEEQAKMAVNKGFDSVHTLLQAQMP